MNRPLLVNNKYINNYLNYVWGELKEKYGSFGTQQYTYNDNSNPDIYYYSFSCSFVQNGKVASLLLHVSKDRGIYQISQDLDGSQETTLTNEIINIFIRSPKGDDLNKHIKSTGVKLKVNTNVKLSGDYYFDKCCIKIEDHSHSGYFYLIFNVDYIHKDEITKKSIKKADEILSALSILIYDYFSLSYNDDLSEDTEEALGINGLYIENENYMDLDEVIETRGYCLPPDSDKIIFEVLSSPTRLNSARLFREALCFRREFIKSTLNPSFLCVDSFEGVIARPPNHSQPRVCHNDLNDIVKKYEIIAYVSAIESILPTKSIKKETKCPECKTKIIESVSGISRKFNEFIDRNANEYILLKTIYKNIYKHRSRFLHAGFNLTPPPSYIPGLPLNILQPELELGMPEYYHNITDWTGYLLRNDVLKEIKNR